MTQIDQPTLLAQNAMGLHHQASTEDCHQTRGILRRVRSEPELPVGIPSPSALPNPHCPLSGCENSSWNCTEWGINRLKTASL